jgi:hypothetical protein
VDGRCFVVPAADGRQFVSRLSLSIPASLAAHKHKLAITAASCTAVTGAVIGALAATAPDAHAATVPVARSGAIHVAVQAPTVAPTTAMPSAAATTASASASPSASATTSSAAPAPTKATKKATVVTTTTTSSQYAGLSAYQIAEKLVPSSQFGCFDWIVTRESGWSVTATNPSSGAYGLGQALPGYKMASVGSDWRTNPVTQIKWVLGYMDSRYGSPCAAQSFWESHNWY